MIEIKPGEFVMYQGDPPAVIQKGEMSLRDYFAAQAVSSLIPHHISMFMDHTYDDYYEALSGAAGDAYQIADAMLKARVPKEKINEA